MGSGSSTLAYWTLTLTCWTLTLSLSYWALTLNLTACVLSLNVKMEMWWGRRIISGLSQQGGIHLYWHMKMGTQSVILEPFFFPPWWKATVGGHIQCPPCLLCTHRHTWVLASPAPRAGYHNAHRRLDSCSCRLWICVACRSWISPCGTGRQIESLTAHVSQTSDHLLDMWLIVIVMKTCSESFTQCTAYHLPEVAGEVCSSALWGKVLSACQSMHQASGGPQLMSEASVLTAGVTMSGGGDTEILFFQMGAKKSLIGIVQCQYDH